MPKTTVYAYQDPDGGSPILAWLENLRSTDTRGYLKCVTAIQRLIEAGFELRRPTADYLRNGIHELRASAGHVNYRLLYFFHGRNTAVIAHGVSKEGAVPPMDIERAIARKLAYESNPELHSLEREFP
jgi:hypothetical protein